MFVLTLCRAALTVAERKKTAEVWLGECQRLGMKTVVHVSHMCLRTARDLAQHAAEIGADSIGMYPPFAPEAPPNLATVALSLDFATRDVELPLYYYHIPAVTGIYLNVSDLIAHARQHSLLPRLAGELLS
jgi:N-acetylneuraminate lyase